MAGNRTILCLALLVVSCANATCFGQKVTVRLADLTNGSPVADQQIYVFGISTKADNKEQDKRHKPAEPSSADMRFVTDRKGEATFDLPKSVPAYFSVRAALNGRHWDCFCLVRIETEQLLQKGLVVKSAYAERKGTPSIQPRANEIVFALRPTPWWVRVFWPLLKG